MKPLSLLTVANNRNTNFWKFWQITMAFTSSLKACWMSEFAKSESATKVQRQFRTKYGLQHQMNKTIHACFQKFDESGCLWGGKLTGDPGLSV